MLTRENSDAPYLVFNIYNPPNPSTKQFSVGFSVDGVFSLSRYEMNLSYSAIHGLSGNITSRNYDFTIEAGLDILGNHNNSFAAAVPININIYPIFVIF